MLSSNLNKKINFNLKEFIKKEITFLKIFSFYFLMFFPTIIMSQEVNEDSIFFFQQLKNLIDQNQFATAHFLLDDRMKKEGMKPILICWMVDNGLKHFFRHENYDIFFLKDADLSPEKNESDSLKSIKIARLRHPQRLLNWVISQFPNNSWAFKLLGDYYDIQLQDFSNIDFIDIEKIKDLETKIFEYYDQAEKLGFRSPDLFNWLGDYYLKLNRLDLAKKYYLKNISKEIPNALSYFRLAEICYRKKQYTQAYLNATRSINFFEPADVYLKYEAIRLAALALKALGDVDKFVECLQECIEILPDVQEAYIDLAQYYQANKDTIEAEKVLKAMLLNNPYDLKGYRAVEHYIEQEHRYVFGDSLFNEMSLKFENWDEVMANIYWSKGNLAFIQNKIEAARKFWEISRNYMRRYLPEDSQYIKQVGDLSRKAKNK